MTAGRPMSNCATRARMVGKAIAAAAACIACLPGTAVAAVSTFGSPLSSPATLNTSENLNYKGIDTPWGTEVFHTPHYGADTALWNTTAAAGAAAPADGQVTKVSLEGCAQAAANGPAPLTQIHFQILSPQPGGGAKVELTSQAFDIPVCGQNGASGSTVSSYVPINLCVSAGDYVDFNDEGGYVENVYRSGVAYQVIGSAQGSTMDSFIRGGGTGNGAVFSPSDSTNGDGFAVNEHEELMLQATLGTGPDATHICPGGTQGLPPAKASHQGAQKAVPKVPVLLLAEHDAVNRKHRASVSIFCRLSAGCDGTAMLISPNGKIRYGMAHFAIAGMKTTRVPMAIARAALKLLGNHHRRLSVTLIVTVGGQTVRQTLRLEKP